jgi:hypothetical protein
VNDVTKTISPNEGAVFHKILPVPKNLAYERNYVDIATSLGNFTLSTILIQEQKFSLQVQRITASSITWGIIMNINETITGDVTVNVTRNSISSVSTYTVTFNNKNNAKKNVANITVPVPSGNPTDMIFYTMSLVSNSKEIWVAPLQYMALPDTYTNATDWKLTKVKIILNVF